MPKKNDAPASFETALSELEQIVTRLESGDLPLEDALNEFERGVQLARQGQVKLQQAEQRVQILLPTAKTLKPRHSHRTPSKWILPTRFRRASFAPTTPCAVLLSRSLFRTLHWLKPCTMAHS
jgi:exodeoxyribonuclease VII small subunit